MEGTKALFSAVVTGNTLGLSVLPRPSIRHHHEHDSVAVGAMVGMHLDHDLHWYTEPLVPDSDFLDEALERHINDLHVYAERLHSLFLRYADLVC